MKNTLNTEVDFINATNKIEIILKTATKLGGFDFLSAKDKKELEILTNLVQNYEQQYYKIDMPKSLVGWIELKMFEKKLKQKELANILEINEVRLSEVLNGKRKINLDLAKRLYQKLDIEPKTILELC